MTTEESSITADTASTSPESTSSNVETSTQVADPSAQAAAASNQSNTSTTNQQSTTPVVTPDGKVAYVPNYKYKAALQEKELDPFFHGLIKDPESEKKVKELFTKVDAFDFIKNKKEQAEQQYQSITNDYNTMADTVTKFNKSVQSNDLSSAFRLAGISKEQIFKWTQQQLHLMEMPPEQRQQYEQFEAANQQKSQLEEQVSHLQKQYEQQAVQSRTMQLDYALNRPEVAKFGEAWDRNGEPGSFKNFVIEEAKKVYYETGRDLSPEQAVGMVMQRFGKFLNVDETAMQSPQAMTQSMPQNQKPVIPNIAGKAASPIKKVPRSIEDLKKLAREARD